MESILVSIKSLLGINAEYYHFDDELIMHINSVFATLSHIGVGPSNGFIIEDSNAVWSDFIDDPAKVSLVKTYVFMKVRLIFDPPDRSNVMEAYQSSIKEAEWRLYSQFDIEA